MSNDPLEIVDKTHTEMHLKSKTGKIVIEYYRGGVSSIMSEEEVEPNIYKRTYPLKRGKTTAG